MYFIKCISCFASPIDFLLNSDVYVILYSLFVFSASCQFSNTRCPRGWTEQRNECYKFTRTPTKNREEAFKKCREYSAELVSVDSEAEHKFIADWLRTNDPQHKQWYTSGNLKNGIWYWDGSGIQFINIENLWITDLNHEGSRGEDAVYTYALCFIYALAEWCLLNMGYHITDPVHSIYVSDIRTSPVTGVWRE